MGEEKRQKAVCLRFADETYFGGIVNAVKAPSRVVRAIWVLVMVTCVVGLMIQATMSIYEFATGSPVTSFSVETPKGMKLPDIVVSLTSRFDKDKLSKYGISPEVGDHIQLGFTTGSSTQLNGRSLTWQIPRGELERMTYQSEYEDVLKRLNISDFKKLVDLLSFDCKDIFDDCWSHGLSFDCCERHNKTVGPLGVGISVAGTTQYADGTSQGMTMRLRLPTDRYQRGPNLMYAAGVVMRLSFDGHAEADRMLLPEGSRAYLAIEATHGKYLSTAKNPCNPNPVRPRVNCVSGCMYEAMFTDCDCMPIDSFTDKKDKPTCHPKESLMCVFFVSKSKGESIGEDVMKTCLSKCLKPCEEWTYRKTVTTFPLSAAILKEYADDTDCDEWANRTTIVDIYYSAVKVSYVEEFHSMGISDLFGILGGLLGLWLGGSIIGLVHLLLFWTYGGNKEPQRP